MATEVIDLEPLFKQWAWHQYNRTTWWLFRMKYLDAKFEVIFDRVKITPTNCHFKRGQEYKRTNVVFDAEYKNDTDDDQTNRFSTQKETISSAVIKLSKGFSKNVEVGIKIPLPDNLVDKAKAVGNFGNSLHISGEEECKQEKNVQWTVDTTIISKRRKATVAQLEVEEIEQSYTFNMKVQMKGVVIVNIKDSKDKLVQTVQNDVATILFDLKEEGWSDNFLRDVKFNLHKGTVIWPFTGSVELKYGISQKVNIFNKPLDEYQKNQFTQTYHQYR